MTSKPPRICSLRTNVATACGRRASRGPVTTMWANVTCADCQAARRADQEAARG